MGYSVAPYLSLGTPPAAESLLDAGGAEWRLPQPYRPPASSKNFQFELRAESTMNAITGTTILIVDDYPPSRYAFRRILAPDGYSFIEAADGATLLRKLAPGLGLAIVDVNLPDVSGFDLCRTVKDRYPALPVVLISASYRAMEQHGGWRGCGADAFLEQPVAAEELRALVRSLVGGALEA